MKHWTGVTDLGEERGKFASRFVFRCPVDNCYHVQSAQTQEAIEKIEADHGCPHQNGITHYAGSVTLTLVEDMWAKLDTAYANLLEEGIDADEFQRRKGVCRGMAEMLTIFMVPHFRTATDITKECVNRRAQSEAGNTEYVTVGLGSRIYELPRLKGKYAVGKVAEGDNVKHVTTGQQGIVTTVSEETGITVDWGNKAFGNGYSTADLEVIKIRAESAKLAAMPQAERTKVKEAHEMGFTAEQLANTFNISQNDVVTILAS